MDETGKLPSTFHSLKYGDLQRWAKKFGIKANLKAHKLVDALTQYVADNELLADSCHKLSAIPSSRIYENRTEKDKTNEHVDELSSEIILLNDVEVCGEVVSSKVKFEEAELNVLGKYSTCMSDDIQEKDITESDHIDQVKEFLTIKPSVCSYVVTDMASGSLCEEERNPLTVDEKFIVNKRKHATSGDCKSSAAVRKTHIPRLNQLPQNQGLAIKPFTAEYWAKLHKRQFDQMDSLDVYMKKKTKRALSLLSPNRTKGTILKESRAESQKSDMNEVVKDPCTFVPTVFTTAKMNINFSEVQKTQHCVLDTPLQDKAEIKKVLSPNLKHSTFGSTRKSLGTPSSGNIHSRMKPKFDLQASLARPITWKPYVGKLKETYARNLRFDVKKLQVKSRDDRRKEVKDNRSIKRIEKQCIRRGITANQLQSD